MRKYIWALRRIPARKRAVVGIGLWCAGVACAVVLDQFTPPHQVPEIAQTARPQTVIVPLMLQAVELEKKQFEGPYASHKHHFDLMLAVIRE